MAQVFNHADLDCPTIPVHLAYKISQDNWTWINKVTMQLYHSHVFNTPPRYARELKPWMIRGYWFITYFCNPSQENLTFITKNLYEFKIFKDTDNLEYLEFISDLRSRIKTS